jgi:hypothetical protein
VPDSLVAVGILFVLVVPGFAFLTGYWRGREAPVAPDLFLIAKAAVASAVVLTVVYLPWWVRLLNAALDSHIPLTRDVLQWYHDDNLWGHHDYLLILGWLVAGAAWTAGFAAGSVVDHLGREGGLLEQAGVWRSPTVWSSLAATMNRDATSSAVLLALITTKQGQTVIGSLDSGGRVKGNVRLEELYLTTTYAADESGNLVAAGASVYIRGEDVESIRLFPKPSSPATAAGA